MSISLDPSVVVRLVTGRPATQAFAARTLLDRLERIGERAFVSDVVVAEAFYALRHHYRIPDPAILEALASLLQDPTLRGESAPTVLADSRATDSDLGFVDRLILQRALDRRTRLVTFDRALAALPGAELLAPV